MLSLKQRILKKEGLCGTHISMGDMYVADIFSLLDFDYIWVDTEHSSMDYRELLYCISMIRANGKSAIVRLQTENYNHTKKVLEMGVDGVIFPYIDTAEQAERALRSTFYPPNGTRGFGPIKAVDYGLKELGDYIRSEDRLCRFIQIESKTAVENLQSIIQLDAIDGYIFGPCDLSGSIGRLNDIYCEENLGLIRDAIRILQQHNKYIGISVGSTDVQVQSFWLDMGIDMISTGTDYDYLAQSAQRNCRQIRQLLKQRSEAYGKSKANA